MHTDTHKKKPAGDGNPTAGHTDALIVPNATDSNKRMLNFAFCAFDLAMDAATVVALIWILVEVLR